MNKEDEFISFVRVGGCMRKKGETSVQDRERPQPQKKKEREKKRKDKKLARLERAVS